MAKTIVGSFDSFDEAQRVARELMDEGYAGSDINVVASNIRGEFREDERVKIVDTHNAATGAVAGGVLGGAAGLAVSLMGLTVPGLGPIIAAGPLAATLSGAGAGVVAGGLIGGLTELGVSKPDAEYYAAAHSSPCAPTMTRPTARSTSCASTARWTSTSARRDGAKKAGPDGTTTPICGRIRSRISSASANCPTRRGTRPT